MDGATAEDNTQAAIEDMFNIFATRREAEAALSDPAALRDLQEHGVDIGKVIETAHKLGERKIGTTDY